MENGFANLTAAQLFAAVGIVLAISEVFIPGFILLPIGIAFLLTAGVALFVQSWVVLLFALAVLLVAVFLFFNKTLRPIHGKTRAYTNAEGMVGQECEVTETISRNGTGYVKLYGDRWQARSYEKKDLVTGSRVVIVKIDGNKVVVEPINKVEEV